MIRFFKKINILICFLILSSCAESLDFNQLDDFSLTPNITSSLIYFTVTPAHFFDASGTIQQNSISDLTDFKGLASKSVRDAVVKIDFNVEIKNEFDREVTFRVEFLNNSNNVLYTFEPLIVASKELDYTFFEEIIIDSNPDILMTRKVKVTLELETTGTQMNPSDLSEFEFKSSINLYIESGF